MFDQLACTEIAISLPLRKMSAASLGWCAGVFAYLAGDPVPMMRRTQHSGRRTAWHEVSHRATPRFLTDRRATLDGAPPDLDDSEPFKISLALHGLQFVTPWITVADGKGKFLSHLELQLTASGDALTAVRWETEYSDEPPAHVSVQTTWEHALEHDLESALALLFFLVACVAAVLAYATCSTHGRSTLAKLLSDPHPDRDLYTHAEHDEGSPGDLAAYRPQRSSYNDRRPYSMEHSRSRAYGGGLAGRSGGGYQRSGRGKYD